MLTFIISSYTLYYTKTQINIRGFIVIMIIIIFGEHRACTAQQCEPYAVSCYLIRFNLSYFLAAFGLFMFLILS